MDMIPIRRAVVSIMVDFEDPEHAVVHTPNPDSNLVPKVQVIREWAPRVLATTPYWWDEPYLKWQMNVETLAVLSTHPAFFNEFDLPGVDHPGVGVPSFAGLPLEITRWAGREMVILSTVRYRPPLWASVVRRWRPARVALATVNRWGLVNRHG